MRRSSGDPAVRIGLVDGPVDTGHPALRRASIRHLPPPYTPTGPFPPGPPPPPGWTYPPGWTPHYPGWTPPPGYPPVPPPGGYHLGLGGTVAVAIGAFVAGTAIGAGVGLSIEKVITEDDTPPGSLDPACTNAPGPRTPGRGTAMSRDTAEPYRRCSLSPHS